MAGTVKLFTNLDGYMHDLICNKLIYFILKKYCMLWLIVISVRKEDQLKTNITDEFNSFLSSEVVVSAPLFNVN